VPCFHLLSPSIPSAAPINTHIAETGRPSRAEPAHWRTLASSSARARLNSRVRSAVAVAAALAGSPGT
jgi:hypothetical protein